MNWKKSVFENFKLYAVTDIKIPDPAILDKIEAAYLGSVDIVQLRSKTLSDRELVALGSKIRMIADHHRKLFFVNDRTDLALAVSADGIHLGQDDLPIASARAICAKAGAPLWIGKSTHNLGQALAAVHEGADYIGVGPIFETPTKPQTKAVGLELIRQLSAKVHIPFVVIGGIDQTNVDQVLEAGAKRIAAVRAIFGAPDVLEAARRFRHRLDQPRNSSNHSLHTIASGAKR